MATPKGKSGNPNGRPKGKPNKITIEAKEVIKNCLDDLSPMLRKKFDALEPKDWITLYCKLAEFVIPKLAAIPAPDPTEEPIESTKFVDSDGKK